MKGNNKIFAWNFETLLLLGAHIGLLFFGYWCQVFVLNTIEVESISPNNLFFLAGVRFIGTSKLQEDFGCNHRQEIHERNQ